MRSKEKSDNRRALPKYLLVLLIAAFFGALAGFAAGIVGARESVGEHQDGGEHGPHCRGPWGIPVTSVVFLGLGWRFYAKAGASIRLGTGRKRHPSKGPRRISAGHC